ncbi:hypothetical protein WPS_00430 [Vulcanimicrobium alpinum]|uniref:DUF697 domain-containing protein n=1 Tax=Vulcanimicrobium alpinum TaxID=3016050 RepID=A0AAN2C8P9_UNVUL|nr:hypothetical protein [Vulcanimicrobium alpinum]BDE04767.1 hypothetical protein WPS_00430 [Vulcanimicrobium alpinum]
MNPASAAAVFERLRGSLNIGAVHAGARRPFKFFLYGDPALVSDLRGVLLAGYEGDTIPPEAAAALETLDTERNVDAFDARAILVCARPGDREAMRLDRLAALKLPILYVVVDPAATATSGPVQAPASATVEEYVVDRMDYDALRGRVLPHLIDCCRGIEVAVGRQLPALRDTVSAKLTRDASLNSLKVAGASAVVDHVPVLGVVLGAFASAGDMMAITGIQMTLMLNIGATYGRDPDFNQLWELLPVVGGGFGWRALARELSGFIPVGGIIIKAAIAYAGTAVVGEGVSYYYRHGRQMGVEDASRVYDDAKSAATAFARDLFARVRRNGKD